MEGWGKRGEVREVGAILPSLGGLAVWGVWDEFSLLSGTLALERVFGGSGGVQAISQLSH